jgi:cysteine desulfurase/selenocysteine lyase
VLDALTEYYTRFNSCGERVRHQWGRIVDEKVEETRRLVLKLLRLKERAFLVSFTLNTTYGINLILNQMQVGGIQKVMTSDIEHNSPFLATMAFARRHALPREVMTRSDDGSIDIGCHDFTHALVVLSSVSNIDGRRLENIDEVIQAVHAAGGTIVIDAAQGMTFGRTLVTGTDADAVCFSSHKMYGPSLGVMVMKRSLAAKIDPTFIGGGMVDDVDGIDSYVLSADTPRHAHTRFEAGLMAWGEIIGLGAAIEWLGHAERSGHVDECAKRLYEFLASHARFHLLNSSPSPLLSLYHRDIDAHLLAEALSDRGIMARSGYFCCHHYLAHAKGYPPLLRFSLGLHNRAQDIDALISSMERIA